MAKILISYFSLNGETFYDGICEELVKNGNDVFRFNLYEHIDFKLWGETFTLNKKGKIVVAEILDFEPDLIIGFNNAIPLDLLENTQIPVFLWDADNPTHFWHKDYIKSNKNRFHYLGFQSYSLDMYGNILGIPKSRYTYCPASTTLKKEELKKTQNISFIGNHFTDAIELNSYKIINSLDMMKFTRSEIQKDYFFNIKDAFKRFCLESKLPQSEILFKKFRRVCEYLKESHYYTGIDRVQHLSQISDLGLTIYGPKSWRKLSAHHPDVSTCYNPEKIQNLEENAHVYNSSKISVNISHPQAVSAFSWRVMDIMASNACVLTEEKKDFDDLFGKYLSEDVKKAIVYSDKYDMRVKAKALLENEKLRLKCVKECQNAIEQNGRWKVRFDAIEKIIDLPLTHIKNRNPQYIQKIIPIEYKHNIHIKHNIKTTLKTSFYLLVLLVVNFPIASFLFSKKTKAHYFKKLDEWKYYLFIR